MEELGLSARLRFHLHVRYAASVGGGMHENEIAYIYFGRMMGTPTPNPTEVSDLHMLSFDSLLEMYRSDKKSLSPWLRHYLAKHKAILRQGVQSTLTNR